LCERIAVSQTARCVEILSGVLPVNGSNNGQKYRPSTAAEPAVQGEVLHALLLFVAIVIAGSRPIQCLYGLSFLM
jgi:hypothetical protein